MGTESEGFAPEPELDLNLNLPPQLQVTWASPEYWGCPECGSSEAWILCDGRVMCSDDDCYTIFAGVAEWAAGRDKAESR